MNAFSPVSAGAAPLHRRALFLRMNVDETSDIQSTVSSIFFQVKYRDLIFHKGIIILYRV